MGVQENILLYMLVHGKENKYRLASALRVGVNEIIEALNALEEEGKIRMEGGRAMLSKGKKTIIAKAGKQKIQPTKESKEEKPKEEVSEEAPVHEEVRETFGQKAEEEIEERIEGTVKFFNPKRGFGFITGDDGKDYYINESSLKEGVAIKADDRVSFKVVQETQGPKAEEVENLTQGGEQFRRTDQEHDQNVA